MKKENFAGDITLLENQIAVILLRSPVYTGKIIVPVMFYDTTLMSQTMFAIAKGPGYRKERKSSVCYMEGSRQWRKVTEDIDSHEHSGYYVDNVKVGMWHFMKHPFVRNSGAWVTGIERTHPDIVDMFDPEDVRMNNGKLEHRVFITCASEVLAVVNLDEGEGIEDIRKIKRGEMMSIS